MTSYAEYARLCEEYAAAHRPVDVAPGPGHYLTGYTPFQELRDSTLSKKGYSSFASETERFPEERRVWGLPAPTSYDPGEGLKLQDARTISRDVSRPSAVFLTTGREKPATLAPDSAVPDMTRYAMERVKSVGVRPSFNVTSAAGDPVYRSIRSQYHDLQARAAQAQKSVSRFIVEEDPFYLPPPEPLVEGVLQEAPVTGSWGGKRSGGAARAVRAGVSPLRRYRDSLRAVQTRYGLRLPSPGDYIDEDINGELQREYRAGSPHSTGRTGPGAAPRRRAHLYRGRASGPPLADSAPSSHRGSGGSLAVGRREGEAERKSAAMLRQSLPSVARHRGLRAGPWEGRSDQTVAAVQDELEREALGYGAGADGPEPPAGNATSSLARTALTAPAGEAVAVVSPPVPESPLPPRTGQRRRAAPMLSYQERLVLSRTSTGAQLGPGSYTPRDAFTTSRRNYGGAPSLAHASSRRTVIGEAGADGTPGPGSYEAPPGLGPKPSFHLNEAGRFVL